MTLRKLLFSSLILAMVFGFFANANFVNPSSANAATTDDVYYVSPDGNDNGPGTKDKPWRTLAKASTAEAGDTVIFLPGEYPGVLQPQNSGAVDAWITFKAAKPGTVTLIGKSADDYHYAVKIIGKKYIHVDGLHIQPQNPEFGRWFRVDSTASNGKCINDEDPGVELGHIKITNMVMEHAYGRAGGGRAIPFLVRNASQVKLKNSTLREFAGSDMSWFMCDDHVVIQGNTITHAGHTPMSFSPLFRFKSNDYFVIRANVFGGGWSRPFETFGDLHVLFEGNVVTHAYHGGLSAGPEAKVMLDHSIFRFNRIYRNFGSPINIHYVREPAKANHTYLYNNLFVDNYTDGVNITDVVENYVFKNNIFAYNDKNGAHRQLSFGGDASNSKYVSNVFWGGGAEVIFNYTNQAFGLGKPLTLKDVQSAEWEADHGNQFSDNMNIKPQFVDRKNRNYALQPDSPLIDAGQALTEAVGSGSGKVIKVEEANYFYDGFGIKGEVGDVISVGTASQQARIVSADYENNTLTLNHSVTWEAGNPVSLAWSGEAPDIGVYEQGVTRPGLENQKNASEKGRASVQIVTEQFSVHPNQPAHFRAVVRGIDNPVSFHWRFGDGTGANGQRVKHSYEEPAIQLDAAGPPIYPIYLTVTDANGRTYKAASFIELVDPRHNVEPLVFMNFNADNAPLHFQDGEPNFKNDDGNWWWRIYHSRPDTTIDIEYQENGNGVGHFTAPHNNYPTQAEIYPEEWNIDKYPYIKFRYRVDPGAPIAIYLEAFSTATEVRQAYVAVAPGAKVDPDKVVADHVLKDDGEWHTMVIDARAIRKKYPNVQQLQKFYIGATNRFKMEQGEGYYLDDFGILPKSMDHAQQDSAE